MRGQRDRRPQDITQIRVPESLPEQLGPPKRDLCARIHHLLLTLLQRLHLPIHGLAGEEVRDAAAILSTIKFHAKYHGFVEGNDITKGTVDVIVTDGFTGNVALKTAEGVGKLSSQFLKEAFKSGPLAMLGYLLSSGAMKKLKSKLDPSKYNGGMFLGLDGVAVKSHGGSNIDGTENAILVAANLVHNGFNKRVADELQEVMAQGALQKQQEEKTAAQ